MTVKQDAEGRYCLNDAHKASGGAKAKQVANWQRSDEGEDLIKSLTPQIRGVNPIVSKPGRYGGNKRPVYDTSREGARLVSLIY